MRFAATLTLALAIGSAALAEPVETEIPDVTAELVELRTSGGVTRLAVRYVNGGAEEARDRPLRPSTRSCSST